MILQHQLAALLRDGEQGVEFHTLVNPWASRWKFAAFAYIAEQYGYCYDGLSAEHGIGRSHPIFAFRRLPDAAERAARTAEQYPHALQGGAVPGMQSGGDGLTPLHEARREVELLHARIKVDLFGRSSYQRVKRLFFAIPVAVLIVTVVNGDYSLPWLLTSGAICAGWFLYLGLAMAIMKRRYTKYADMLSAAGVNWPSAGSRR